MADLVTTAELATWTDKDPAVVATDPLALDVIEKVSDLICFLGGHDGTKVDASGTIIPEWTLTPGPSKVPFDVQMVAFQVALRSYNNPKQILQEGNIGPIGGDRVADVAALLLDLSDSERTTVTAYNTDGDPVGSDKAGNIFTIPTTRGAQSTLVEATLYVGDDQQVGLAESADPREWMIPLFNPGDPGDPNLYEE